MRDLTSSEKVKRFMNKKIIFGCLAMFFVLVIVFVSSIIPLAFDVSKWGSAEFISDEIIIVALTIISMVCLILIGQPYNASNPNSKLAKANVKFNESLQHITHDSVSGFLQWIRVILQPSDLKLKYERLLSQNGITDTSILNLSRNDLKILIKQPLKTNDRKFFKQITKNQYKLIISILNGKETIEYVSPQTYLRSTNIDANKTTSEKLSNQQKKKTSILVYSVLSKVLIVLICGLIFGALGKDITIGNTTGAILMKLFVRLFACFSSGFMGFIVGNQINDIDADYIEEKCVVHTRFLDDKEFKPKTEQELAREEYIEHAKKEQEQEMIKLMNNSNKIEMKQGDEQL